MRGPSVCLGSSLVTPLPAIHSIGVPKCCVLSQRKTILVTLSNTGPQDGGPQTLLNAEVTWLTCSH